MSQRQFDMENEQDYTELFKLFSPEIVRIKKMNDNTIILEASKGLVIDLPSCFNIKWGNLTYVDRPVDKSKWIGRLCRFWDNNPDHYMIDILQRINEKNICGAYESRAAWYTNCCPVKREEIKFVEDNE